MRKLIIGILVMFSLLLVACSSGPGKYNTFAQCLTEKEAVMFGTEWCSHCQNQKREFGKSFGHIMFIDCDKNGEECLANGVRSYPTWKIDGEYYTGEQSLERLAYLSDCELVEDITA
jgi:hypothetical protein